MKRTNKAVAGVLIAGLLATLVLVPQAAEAGGRHWGHGGGYGHHHGHHGGGYYAPFWGGLAVGAVTGVVVGSILAPRVYAAPPPVVYQPRRWSQPRRSSTSRCARTTGSTRSGTATSGCPDTGRRPAGSALGR